MSNSADDFDRGSAAAYLEHARWLLEWHNKRSEAATSRAATLLGFLGVILAALLQGAALLDGDLAVCSWIFLGLTGISLSGAAYFAIQAIDAKQVEMPKIAALRASWRAHLHRQDEGTPAEFDVAESFLNSTDLQGASPVQAASDEADLRVASFKKSVRFTAAALASLALLAITVAATPEGGEHEQQRERERPPGQRK